MINHNINPVLLSLPFGFEVRYYGLTYVFGMILIFLLVKYMAKRLKRKDAKSFRIADNVMDLVIYVVVSGVLGGRIFYFVFYNFNTIFTDFFEIFKVWNGGMSFHGGLIGAIIGMIIYSKVHKKDFFLIADLVAVPIALALFFGRISNFINGELYGRLYNGALCINYESSKYLANAPNGCRYPSQLVEACKNLVIFFMVFLSFKRLDKSNYKTGSLAFTFVLMYGVFRFFIEYIREPDAQIGFLTFGLTMGQILCVFMILVGIIFFVIRYTKLENKLKSIRFKF